MKKILVFLFFCAAIHCTLKGQDQFTAYDGTVLNKGDMLTIGYHSVTSSYYITVKEKIINEYGREQYLNVKDDITYSKARITGFITPGKTGIFSSGNLVVLAKDEKGKDLYIDANQAIERGELVSVQADPIHKDAVYLSDDILMACVIRVNAIPVTDNVLLSFIGTKDKELQRRCITDEFELNNVKPQYMELLNKLMDEFDFSAVYYIKMRLGMDKYDFSAGGYPLDILPGDKTFLPYGHNGAYNFIIEDNREKYRFLPVAADKAEANNKRRKGTGRLAHISPLVYGKFYFKLLDKRMELRKDPMSIINMENVYRHKVVGAQLVGLEVYDYPHCEYNFIGKIE